ncbi:MAG: C39 family peptidase [Symbiobacteriaceae bacterium]|nr:C39 family peptidase [Symbiobacteriaceae bacterium]
MGYSERGSSPGEEKATTVIAIIIVLSLVLSLILLPLLILAVPLVILRAGSSAQGLEQGEARRHAQEQVAYVEEVCYRVSRREVDEWLVQQQEYLNKEGVDSEHISYHIPSPEELALKSNEVIILWSVLYSPKEIDASVYRLASAFIAYETDIWSSVDRYDRVTLYAQVTVVRYTFQEVLTRLSLTEEESGIAMLMYDFWREANQLQKATWSGNDASYAEGDLKDVFPDGLLTYYHQRDSRWGSEAYAGESIGAAGCGPTALAMVISSLLERPVTPSMVAQWSTAHGYAAYQQGSYHSLIPAAAEYYGLRVSSANDREALRGDLAKGELVIALMGPGSFTPSGHFIVLAGLDFAGEVRVADPVSVSRSQSSWALDLIWDEAKGTASSGGPFWVLRR